MLALPVAGFGAGIVRVVESSQEFIDYRHRWLWNLLFVPIYALFLDRWIKKALLDGADDCDEIDALRRSMISPRFVAFVVLPFGLAVALGELHVLKITDVPWLPEMNAWAAIPTPLAIPLPVLSAGTVGRRAAVDRRGLDGRPVLPRLFMLIKGAALFSLLADTAATRAGVQLLPDKPWAAAIVTGAGRLIDCLLLSFVGYGLAALFRERTGWRQPTPDDHAYRGVRARKA